MEPSRPDLKTPLNTFGRLLIFQDITRLVLRKIFQKKNFKLM